MAENITTGYILETYTKSGLHPKNGVWVNWPKETTVVCKIDFTDNTNEIVIKHNILHGDHAEKVLIEYINTELDVTKIKRITIYTNYSPCIQCSGKLQILKGNVSDLQIKFSSLYNIKRPSCAESACNCDVDDPGAFRMLIELGALPFQEEDWDDLIYLLMRNDELNGRPTSDLRGIRDGDLYGDWRNGEDEKMKADYQTLRAPIFPSTPNKNTSSTHEPSGPSKGDQARGSTGDVKPTASDSNLEKISVLCANYFILEAHICVLM